MIRLFWRGWANWLSWYVDRDTEGFVTDDEDNVYLGGVGMGPLGVDLWRLAV